MILILNLSAMCSHQMADKVCFDCLLGVGQGREAILIVNHCGLRLNHVGDKNGFDCVLGVRQGREAILIPFTYTCR